MNGIAWGLGCSFEQAAGFSRTFQDFQTGVSPLRTIQLDRAMQTFPFSNEELTLVLNLRLLVSSVESGIRAARRKDLNSKLISPSGVNLFGFFSHRLFFRTGSKFQ